MQKHNENNVVWLSPQGQTFDLLRLPEAEREHFRAVLSGEAPSVNAPGRPLDPQIGAGLPAHQRKWARELYAMGGLPPDPARAERANKLIERLRNAEDRRRKRAADDAGKDATIRKGGTARERGTAPASRPPSEEDDDGGSSGYTGATFDLEVARAEREAAERRAEDDDEAVSAPRAASKADRLPIDDFTAFSPDHSYIYKPDGASWSATAVNARVFKIEINTRKGRKKISASTWLDRNDAVEQRTWAPGRPQIIDDMLFDQGGAIAKQGARVFNTYRPPLIAPVVDDDVSLWQSHLYELWPDDARHIELFFAHRVQRPEEKINHALLLAGPPGVGKDAMIAPLVRAVGPWNVREIHPAAVLGNFNDFVEAVVLRISEIKDLGDISRNDFYEATKTLLASPPDTLRCNKKHIPAYYVLNIVSVIMTSNYKTSGLYLKADDRRHFVAWSNILASAYPPSYWTKYWAWLDAGGAAAMAQHLRTLDLSGFDPKAPPPKTPAFWEIVASFHTAEQDDMADIIESLGRPAILTIADVVAHARTRGLHHLAERLLDPANSRRVVFSFEEAGYRWLQNPYDKTRGRWRLGGRRVSVYRREDLTDREGFEAVRQAGGQ